MVNARPRASSASYLQSLPILLPPIFEQAQHTTANHRKNHVSLRKIQEQCSTITEMTPRGTKLVGEKAFNTAFIEMVNSILSVKKGVGVADRVVKFIASYVAYTTEQDLATRTEEEEDIDTPYTRFVVKLLRHLLAGMEAKDKNVRFRVTLLTVSMVNGLGEINEDLYILLRKSLLERAQDKEAAVRVQAALGLAKLQSGEDEDDLEEGQEPLSEVLLDLLNYDPAAEVRRAALYNLPRTAATLPHILTRTRDIDPILRRTVFHGSLSAIALPDARLLSIAQREQVVRNGLGDREGSVRKASAAMLGGWVDQTEGDLVEFLNRFDVVSSEVAEEALLSVFVTKPEVFESIEFPDEYWTSLTPERAFLARVFVDHCIAQKDENRLEETLPVVTALAFRIQDEYNSLVSATNDENGEIAEQAFIVGELLCLALNLDYADEIGRRKMFQLAREMISQANLPESLIPKCMDILCKIANSERDLIRVVVDVVSELREGEGDEEELDQPTSSDLSTIGSPTRRRTMVAGSLIDDPEQAVRKALVDLRSLLICISMLERITSKLQDNSVFHGLLPDLIIPAVQNTEEPALRDQGLVCLGLCCMLDAKMASNSFALFVQQISQADDELQVKVVQIVYDLLMVHDIETLVAGVMPVEKLVELVRHTLNQDVPEVQAAACEGAVKLMLAGMISDAAVLQSLILLYFSPETADNQPLRQCLSYSLPAYCYSSSAHQRSLLSIFSSTFDMLAQLHEDAEDEPMLPLAQMGLILVDWLDPQKAVIRDGLEMDHTLHLNLGIEVLKALLIETSKEVRKALLSFLGKLNLPEPEDVEAWQIQSLQLLVLSIPTKRPLADASSRNSLARFDTVIQKKYPEILDGFNQDVFRGEQREEVRELFGFIDDVEERDAETASEAGSRRPKGGRSGRGLSRDWSEAPTETTVTTMSALDDDDDDDEDDDDEDDNDDDDDDEEAGGSVDPDPTPRKPAPAPSKSKPAAKASSRVSGGTSSRKSRRSDLTRVAEEDDETDGDGDDVESILGRQKIQADEESEEESDEEEDSDSDDPLA